MKSKELYFIMAAGVIILAAILAYNAIDSKPRVSNFYLATDMTGKDRTTAFSPTSHVYIFFDVHGLQTGTGFQSRWYGMDLDGQDPNTPLRTIDYTYTEGDKLYFELSSIGNWPAGNYKVEVYMNDAKVGEQTFSVQ